MATIKPEILIVESDAAFSERLAGALRGAGYSPITTTKGSEALKILTDNEIKLVLLDVAKTDIESYELLLKKKADARNARIPVYMISAQGETVDMNRIPPGSVQEVFMAMYSNVEDISGKVDNFFGTTGKAAPSPSVNIRGGATKVLWVEDDKLIGTILEKKLISSGFDLSHAKSGEEALEMAKNIKPDAVVLDLLLPGISGFDVLQELNKMPNYRGIPVMILSNLSKPSDMERAKAMGAKRFLIKAATSLEQIVKEIKGMKA